MAIDPQKEALYAEITRRAGLYTHMLLLQRNGADVGQIDIAIAAIGNSESEIRRMSDEVNDRIWYANYGKMLGLLETQAEYFPELLAGQKETHGSVTALSAQFQTLSETVDELERGYHELNARHAEQIEGLAADIAAIKKVLADRPAQRVEEHAALDDRLKEMESRLAALEAGYAHPKP